MPRAGGVYSLPPGTEATTGTTILSTTYNNFLTDLVNDLNDPRPITAGGTGGTSVITGWDGLAAKGTDIASASTINLTTATGPSISITGTTTITAVTLAEGSIRFARAAGAFQLTASASLIVNGSTSTNLTVTAGDLLMFRGGASSTVNVARLGTPASASAVPYTAPTTTVGASIALLEGTTNGTNKVSLKAPDSVASDKTVTFQDVTGTVYVSGGTDVAVADGGTGASSFTANYVLLGNGTSAFQTVAPSTSGNVLTSNGTTWQSTALPASGQPIPTASPYGVGTMALLLNVSGGSISSGSTVAGSAIANPFISTAPAISTAGAQTGTWKYLGTGTVGNNQGSYFVRTA